jgi:hypothetical protein
MPIWILLCVAKPGNEPKQIMQKSGLPKQAKTKQSRIFFGWRKAVETHESPWKPVETDENPLNPMKTHGNRMGPPSKILECFLLSLKILFSKTW